MLTAYTPFSYDLHSHTYASDGRLSPEELVLRAVEMSVNVLAITDHDTVSGLNEAYETIQCHQLPLKLIAGVEISALWEDRDIHIVGLDIDPNHVGLTEFLVTQKTRRIARANLITKQLEKYGIPGVLEGSLALARGGMLTRAHIARYLIAQGKVTSIAQAFSQYLSQGKRAYVPPQWCIIKDVVRLIHDAGGYAVLAHPARYKLTAKWLKRLLTTFKDAGGDAMEVAQCQQVINERKQLGDYAQHFNLLASQGSDFHYPCPWIELGKNLSLPDNVVPIWTRFPSLE